MTESKAPRKARVPFEERSLLRQEKDITSQCEFRLLKLPADSMRRVLADLQRSVDDQVKRNEAALKATIPPSAPSSIGDI